MEEGKFREDLFARINMWTFALPGLADRREDIEPNIDYELAKFCQAEQCQIRFDREARKHYVQFACSSQAAWRGNFRELGASISRMATFAERGRISQSVVEEEIQRLSQQWQPKSKLQLPEQVGKSTCLSSSSSPLYWMCAENLHHYQKPVAHCLRCLANRKNNRMMPTGYVNI